MVAIGDNRLVDRAVVAVEPIDDSRVLDGIAWCAACCYGISQLVKWAFNRIAELFKRIALYVWEQARPSVWNEIKGLCVAFGGMTVSSARDAGRISLCVLRALGHTAKSAALEVKHFFTAIPEAVVEAGSYPYDFLKGVCVQLCALIKSVGHEIARAFRAGVSGSYHLGQRGISLARRQFTYTASMVVSAFHQLRDSIGSTLGAIAELRDSSWNCSRRIARFAWSGMKSSGYELVRMARAVGEAVGRPFVQLAKGLHRAGVALSEWVRSCGHEIARCVLSVPESTQELRKGTATIAVGVGRYLGRTGSSALHEVPRCARSGVEAVYDFAELSQNTVCGIASALGAFLCSGAHEAADFLEGVAAGIPENAAPAGRAIEGVARALYRQIHAGAMEVVRGAGSAGNTAYEGADTSYRAIRAVATQLWAYLRSVRHEGGRFMDGMREDLPDTWRVFVQDPLRDFYHDRVQPRMQWMRAGVARRIAGIRARLANIRARLA